MTVRELRQALVMLPEAAQDAVVAIVAADMGQGGDTYATLNHIDTHNATVLLGATDKMCGDSPTRHST